MKIEKWEWVFLILMLGLILSGAFFMGRDFGMSAEREKAKAAGVGRWTADQETGKAEFTYGVKENGK